MSTYKDVKVDNEMEFPGLEADVIIVSSNGGMDEDNEGDDDEGQPNYEIINWLKRKSNAAERKTMNRKQKAFLITQMEKEHTFFVTRSNSSEGRVIYRKKWESFIPQLNSIPGGIMRTVKEWQKVWVQLKNKTKNKANRIEKHSKSGLTPKEILNDLDRRILKLISEDEDRTNRKKVVGSPNQETLTSEDPTSQLEIGMSYRSSSESAPSDADEDKVSQKRRKPNNLEKTLEQRLVSIEEYLHKQTEVISSLCSPLQQISQCLRSIDSMLKQIVCSSNGFSLEKKS